MARRPDIKAEWIEHVLNNPIRTVVQANGERFKTLAKNVVTT